MRQFCPNCWIRLPKKWTLDVSAMDPYNCECGSKIKTRFSKRWLFLIGAATSILLGQYFSNQDVSNDTKFWVIVLATGASTYIGTYIVMLPYLIALPKQDKAPEE